MRAMFDASRLHGPFSARNQKQQTQVLSKLFDNSQMQQHNHAKYIVQRTQSYMKHGTEEDRTSHHERGK
jgi:hypothetical protein